MPIELTKYIEFIKLYLNGKLNILIPPKYTLDISIDCLKYKDRYKQNKKHIREITNRMGVYIRQKSGELTKAIVNTNTH